VTILFRPIFICLIDNDFFLTPPFNDLLPPLNSALINDSEHIINHFISLLSSFFTHLNLKEDIYSMGKFSEYIAAKLEMLQTVVSRENVSIFYCLK